ncbi:pyrroloquinoline quinone biosynthesis protein PqqF [Erwiniaceae bacterium BAC15a-03b]|uniref:Coenzyme PQQ synthesis protein F n=1 Tax=Winslowiella arboricola TaxID=2978220 RepID=A0A9J6PSI2_9GAMM|nr:pyrroloquinoline quinone biosynthesis protein PqqF [Winslowiella arboricola]MCU5779662.1 pyrroloquinoline quinone biosynthesis protein PqqF [Winslowiella arboricola]
MQQLTLANGVQVNLLHDPQATRAAALIQLTAGSHDAPSAWPGLAHLLEHLVFAGSRDYPGDARLMAWAQSQGARLNATTGDTCTAWFFDVSADLLEQGVARLVDMLAHPLLTLEAIGQEVAVIDAEYRMLASDSDTLCAAAMRIGFASPTALQAFHVGNAHYFGADLQALQQALRDYHQQHFCGGKLTLWLQGPQSLDQLAVLAETYATCFAPGIPPQKSSPGLSLQPTRHFGLRSDGDSRLRLSFCLSDSGEPQRQQVTLLRQFLSDEAPFSLMATLRAQNWSDGVQLLLPYCSDRESILSIEFLLCSADVAICAQLEALFFSWLQQLTQTGARQLQHYARLAQQQFARQTPVDQLRARAFTFPPPEALDADFYTQWHRLLAQLKVKNLTRLRVAAGLAAEPRQSQGFTLQLSTASWPALAADAPPAQWQFYPQNSPLSAPELPSQQIDLPHLAGGKQGVLLISPAIDDPLSLRWGVTIQASLRLIIAECAHAGGSLSFACYQGRWLLQLRADNAVMLATVDRILLLMPLTLNAQGERQYRQLQQNWQSEIAVRALLSQLPLLINGDSGQSASAWCAALYGGDNHLHQQLARLLTRFPASVNAERPEPAVPQPAQARYTLPTNGEDAALLLFCPLVEQSASCLAAWRMLAALFEPLFFRQLRGEKNLGYVVSCRFQSLSGVSGLLFAVQSPTHSNASILAHINEFIMQMDNTIATVDPQWFAEHRQRLYASLTAHNQDADEGCREQWLTQQGYAEPLNAAAINQLTPARLYQYYQRLVQQRAGWWIIEG